MKLFRMGDVLPQGPNLLLHRRLDFSFELLPFRVERVPYRKIANFFVAGLNQFFQPAKPFGYPVIAQVEPTNFCNLSCPLCLTTSETGARPRASLPLETFKNLIDEVGDYLLLIVLWSWGEPFLNPDVFDMITYAKAKRIVVHSSTHGNVPFNDEKADRLVDSGLDSLVFALDGATQETYAKYRRGGRVDAVISNIRNVVAAKQRKGSKTPLLTVRFVVMQHNEHEVHVVRDLARELGVDMFTVKTVDLPPARGADLDSDYAPDDRQYRRYDYEPGGFLRKKLPFDCMRPSKRITLNANGQIVSCEWDYKALHSFGPLSSRGDAMRRWKGKEAASFRAKFNLGNNDFYLCRDCTFRDRVADDCNIQNISLK